MAASQSSIPPASHQLQDLAAQHAALDLALQHLHQKKFFSAADELEAAKLKKRKLQLKDLMRAITGEA